MATGRQHSVACRLSTVGRTRRWRLAAATKRGLPVVDRRTETSPMAVFRRVVDLRVRFFQRAPKAGGVVSTLANAHAFIKCRTMCLW